MADTLEEITRYDSAVEVSDNKDEAQEDELSSPHNASTDPQSPIPTNQSRLLALPPELQLLIWEFTVISPEPLHINCPCDSSYGGWTEEYYSDQELWESGTKQPPWQPSLTRVCRSIRADALPMFYKYNAFQAGYCYETDTEIVVDWLKTIGEENRLMLRDFFFFDANRKHDVNCPKDLKRLRRCEVFKGMGGGLESEYDGDWCKHHVRFLEKVEDEELEGLEGLFQVEAEEV